MNASDAAPTLQAKRYRLGTEASEVQERAAQALEADPEGFVARYRERFGSVLNADNASELFDEYAATPESRSKFVTAVRGPASALVDEMYRRSLAEPIPSGKAKLVLFTAGGNGSGKSTTLATLPDAAIVFDSTFSQLEPSKAKVEQALDAGYDVALTHVSRAPVTALSRGVLTRATGEGRGRTVPIRVMARTHAQSREVFLALADQYATNPRVHIQAYDNQEGTGLVPVPLDVLRSREYPDVDALTATLQSALDAERAAGRVPDAVYPGTTHQAERVESGVEPDVRPFGRAVPPAIRPETQENLATSVVDTLDTGEQQPRLPGAGAVRDTDVRTPQFEAPFSLGREAQEADPARNGLLDIDEGPQDTPEREPAESEPGEDPREERRPALRGVAASPARARESHGQRDRRRRNHYDEVFHAFLDAAQAVDPNISTETLRAEFDVRVNFLDEQQGEYRDSGQDPRDLLRAIAAAGGIGPESDGGLTGELRWLKEGNRFGVVAGVSRVFREKRTLDDRGQPKTGLGFDVMLQRLQQQPRFQWLENTDMLIDAIDDAIRQGEQIDAFPGTSELARTAGMQPRTAWWRDSWRQPSEMVAPEPMTAESYQAAFGGTKEQAEALVQVIEAMGIPLERIRVVKGGTPGSGALRQDDAASLRRFLEGDPVVSLTGSEFAPGEGPLTVRVPHWYRQHYGGSVELPSVGHVQLDERAVRASIGHGLSRRKATAFAAVPDVLRQGRILHTGPWKEGEGTGRAIVVGAPITMGGTPYVALVLVHEDPNTRRMYVHEVAVRDEIPRRRSRPGRPSEEVAHSGASEGFLRSILENLFAVNDPDILYQDAAEPAPLFYSKLRQVLEEKMPNRASGPQILQMLRNPQAGVKAEELAWSGLLTWLAQKGVATKVEVLASSTRTRFRSRR